MTRFVPSHLTAAAIETPRQETCGLTVADAAWKHVVTEQQTPPELPDAVVEPRGFLVGNYRLEWWDTRAGEILKTHRAEAEQEGLRLGAPAFGRDLAVKIRRP